MKKTLIASVLYPTKLFDTFLTDILTSIKSQTKQDFSILFFLDGIPQENIQANVDNFHIQQKIFYKQSRLNLLSPASIRQEIINFAYKLGFDILIFFDFDEVMLEKRVETTLLFLENQETDFVFCNALITDSNLNPNGRTLFMNKKIPSNITNISALLRKNFIGLGGLSLKLKRYNPILKARIPNNIAFDWFLSTLMLLSEWKGKKIDECLVLYRQYENNFIGIEKQLDQKTLNLGLNIKKQHYSYFAKIDYLTFAPLLEEINELENYLQKNQKKYIRIINTYFRHEQMCWWENIKSLQELQEWI